MYHLCSTAVLGVLILGLAQRHHTVRHAMLMTLAFVADVSLVLWIELSRHAVETTLSNANKPFVLFHAGVSLITLVGYIALMVSGRKAWRERVRWLPAHRKLAIGFWVCRLTNYVTSFWITSWVHGQVSSLN